MDKRVNSKRKAPISYRPPAGLEEEFYARAHKSGLSLNAFITKAVFDKDAPRQSPRPQVERKMLGQLLAQAAQIRDDLHEICMNGGEAGNALLLEEAIGNLVEIRSALLKIMGRKP